MASRKATKKVNNRLPLILAVLVTGLLLIGIGSRMITESRLRIGQAEGAISRSSTWSGKSTNSKNIKTSSSVKANSNQLYVASISTKPNVEVGAVNGLGLEWNRAAAQCGGRGATRTETWYAYGSPSSSEPVNAVLTKSSLAGVITVTAYSGANSQIPVSNIVSKNSNGNNSTNCSNGKDNDNYSLSLGASADSVVYSAVSIRHYSHSAKGGFKEFSEIKTSRGSGDDAGLAVMDQKLSSDKSVNVSGTTSREVDYAVVALQINPEQSGTSHSPTSTPVRTGTTNNPSTATPRITSTPVPARTPTSTPRPTATATPTRTPTPTPASSTGGVSGDFPCGKFPNANPGCMNVSYQSWFDNVPATSETMNVNYTPRLLHQHYECALPAARANGQYLRRAMSLNCQLIRYNSPIAFISSNSAWIRSHNQGSSYEHFNLNLPACQSGKYEGRECKTEHVHTVRASDMSSNTEMRFTPNVKFAGMGGTRHFLSSNWQTGIGYRSTSEFTSRYWIGECGTYQRVILRQVDKYMRGNEAISTVSGTVTIPFTTNGGCGDQFKTFVFLDPAQHTRNYGSQTGTTLMEVNSHFSGNLTWDTTKASNGVHSLLFINMEGTNEYVSASGVAVRYNVQN